MGRPAGDYVDPAFARGDPVAHKGAELGVEVVLAMNERADVAIRYVCSSEVDRRRSGYRKDLRLSPRYSVALEKGMPCFDPWY
jgi:hypothetical protein